MEYSFAKASVTVVHAYRESPIYRRFFSDAGFEPGDLKSWDDFERLPFLERRYLTDCADEIFVKGSCKNQFNRVTTGRSSGHPVTVYHPKNVNRAAALWRSFDWWNVHPGDKVGTVYRGKSSVKERLKESVVRWPGTFLHLDASSISEFDLRKFVQKWNKAQPVILYGYVGGLDILADYLLMNEEEFFAPIAVWATSAPLGEVQRRKF